MQEILQRQINLNKDTWDVKGITFHFNKDVNEARRDIPKEDGTVLYIFGPWVGELYLELNYWAPFIKFIRENDEHDDKFMAYSYSSREPLYYNGIDYFNGMSKVYEDKIISINGPSINFNEEGLKEDAAALIFNEMLEYAYEYAHEMEIKNVILVTPMTHWKGLILGFENEYSEFLIDRIKYGNIIIPNLEKFSREAQQNLKKYNVDIFNDKYICIFPSDYAKGTWQEEKWYNVIEILVNELQVKVIMIGNKKKYDNIEGVLPLIYNNPKFIDLSTYLTFNPEDYISIIALLTRNAKLSICSTQNIASLIAWSRGKMIYLSDATVNYASILGIFKELIGLERVEIVYGEHIKDIQVVEVSDAINLLL